MVIKDVGSIKKEQIEALVAVLAENDGHVAQTQESNDIVDIDVAFAARSLGLVRCHTHGSWASVEWYDLTDAGRTFAGLQPKKRNPFIRLFLPMLKLLPVRL